MDIEAAMALADRAFAVGGDASDETDWGQMVADARSEAVALEAREWEAGYPDPLLKARGAHVVKYLHGEPVSSGGECGWLAKEDVGEDGCLVGWEENEARWRRMLALDDEAFVCVLDGGGVGEGG